LDLGDRLLHLLVRRLLIPGAVGHATTTEGLTLLVVTHEERVSRAARRVLRLEDGRLAAAAAAASASSAIGPSVLPPAVDTGVPA
jgi:ABC-type thiamine transport system ATPase subunit